MSKKSTSKRSERKHNTAEEFTPAALVNETLDRLERLSKNIFKDPTKTYLDPACGNGNMMIETLRKKIISGNDPLQALQTIFGCDCMRDNIMECRLRLLGLVREFNFKITYDMCKAVLTNVVWTPIGERYPEGSLSYLDGNEFERTPDKKDVERLLEVINGKAEANEELDVKEAETIQEAMGWMTGVFEIEK